MSRQLKSVDNIYGKAQVGCFERLTEYTIAEQSRKDICNKYYDLRDCMVPKLRHNRGLMDIFKNDFIPFVTRRPYSCDGTLKYLETTAGPGLTTTTVKGATNTTGGLVRPQYHDPTIIAVIAVGCVVTAVVVVLLIWWHIRSTRNTRHQPKKSQTASNSKIQNQNYENVTQNSQKKWSLNESKRNDGKNQTSKYENVTKAKTSTPWKMEKSTVGGFKKLSESDSEVSPGYLSILKKFEIAETENSVTNKIGQYNNIEKSSVNRQSPIKEKTNTSYNVLVPPKKPENSVRNRLESYEKLRQKDNFIKISQDNNVKDLPQRPQNLPNTNLLSANQSNHKTTVKKSPILPKKTIK